MFGNFKALLTLLGNGVAINVLRTWRHTSYTDMSLKNRRKSKTFKDAFLSEVVINLFLTKNKSRLTEIRKPHGSWYQYRAQKADDKLIKGTCSVRQPARARSWAVSALVWTNGVHCFPRRGFRRAGNDFSRRVLFPASVYSFRTNLSIVTPANALFSRNHSLCMCSIVKYL